MTLNDILQSAQGGRAVGNLAARFGLSEGEAQAAARAMIPTFSIAFERLAAHPAALGGLLAEMTNGAHAVSYADPDAPAAALSPEALGRSARPRGSRRRSTMSQRLLASVRRPSAGCCRSPAQC